MEGFLRTYADTPLQTPAAVAVVITTVLRPQLKPALESIFSQTFVGPIHVLVGIDSPQGDLGILDAACATRPAHCTVQVFWPGYSTSTRHGGVHLPGDGGALRCTLTHLANSQYVAYLDDDNWWHPDHLAELRAAVERAQWGYALRWFVHPETRRPIAIDVWESVGPGRGLFNEKFGGFVDPSCLMIDKLACPLAASYWNLPLTVDPMSADRNVFDFLSRHHRCSGTDQASVYYTLNANDGLHDTRVRLLGEAYESAGEPVPSARTSPGRHVGTTDPNLLSMAATAVKAGRLSEAEGICRELMEADPSNAAALAVLGITSTRRGQLPEAIAFYERALALMPQNDQWLGDLAELNRLAFRTGNALAAVQRALELGAPTPHKHLCASRILLDLGRHTECAQHLVAAIQLDPEHVVAHCLLAESLLRQGAFRAGWIEYEWRNRLSNPTTVPRGLKVPVWNGMAMPESRILLIGDQGYGDTIQFSRYVPWVAERCQEVVLACSGPLKGLLSRISGVGCCFDAWADLPKVEAYAMLSSLPYLFNTDSLAIPSADKPYLSVDTRKSAEWATRLSAAGPNPGSRVGICWSGRPEHGNDRRRSVPLAAFEPLAGVTGIQYVSLQKDTRPADAKSLPLFPHLVDFSADLANFDETAALISNLDLVITIDSAVAHLAGALGKAVWLMTPSPADWRWLVDRSDSPWYPTLRLFRQPHPGDWLAVVDAIRLALEGFRPIPPLRP